MAKLNKSKLDSVNTTNKQYRGVPFGHTPTHPVKFTSKKNPAANPGLWEKIKLSWLLSPWKNYDSLCTREDFLLVEGK